MDEVINQLNFPNTLLDTILKSDTLRLGIGSPRRHQSLQPAANSMAIFPTTVSTIPWVDLRLEAPNKKNLKALHRNELLP